MSVVEPGSTGRSLVDRVKSILTQPSATWDVIEAEPATIGELYKGYVAPLAAIPAVCGAVGLLAFGVGAFGISFRPSPVWVIVQYLTSYVMTLVMVYVLALIIDALAPNFGGVKNQLQAFKLAAYSGTASWVAGVFGLLPMIGGLLALLGALYTLYLLYRGLPKLMKSPEDKTTSYFVVILVVTLVLGIVIAVLTSHISNFGGPLSIASRHDVGTVSVPGAGSINLGKLQEQADRAEAAAKQMEAGKDVPATDPEVLKAYLPASVAGFSRTEVSASSGGVGGFQGSGAEGAYEKGDSSMRLTVSDLGMAGAMAGMANAFNVHSSKETATGYEKVGKVDGRMTQESYDKSSRHGEYSVLVADRFMVQATGERVSMDDLKAAVNAVGVAQLEGLAKKG
ncbi:MAG: hypothetical protein JWQ29_1302 [Phenylobacterium sp.]|nr:hypothetical protein [Phenylobacterium sp.]